MEARAGSVPTPCIRQLPPVGMRPEFLDVDVDQVAAPVVLVVADGLAQLLAGRAGRGPGGG